MLPLPSDSTLPAVLKERCELLGMSPAQLACAVGIHLVTPGRDAEQDYAAFSRPRPGLWLKLNLVLGYELPQDTQQDH